MNEEMMEVYNEPPSKNDEDPPGSLEVSKKSEGTGEPLCVHGSDGLCDGIMHSDIARHSNNESHILASVYMFTGSKPCFRILYR